jgi:hypothetical protein
MCSALGQYAEQLGVEPTIPLATDRYNVFHAEVLAEKMLAEGKDQVLLSQSSCFRFADMGRSVRV